MKKTDWENVVLDFKSYLSAQLKPDAKEVDSTHIIILSMVKAELDALIEVYTKED